MEQDQPGRDPEGQGKKYNKRERQGENWLASLQLLPPPVYQEGKNRLLRGASAASVARWLESLTARGSMPVLKYNTLRAHVQHWRKQLLARAKLDQKWRRQSRRKWNRDFKR